MSIQDEIIKIVAEHTKKKHGHLLGDIFVKAGDCIYGDTDNEKRLVACQMIDAMVETALDHSSLLVYWDDAKGELAYSGADLRQLCSDCGKQDCECCDYDWHSADIPPEWGRTCWVLSTTHGYQSDQWNTRGLSLPHWQVPNVTHWKYIKPPNN